MGIRRVWASFLVLAALGVSSAVADDLAPLLQSLRGVGPKGAGSLEAAAALERLARVDAAELPTVLAALDDAGPLAANWIRSAVDTIAERALQRGGTLPALKLEQFTRDAKHNPRARRLAYEWLVRVDPAAPDRLVAQMLDDPSLELRRDAVTRLIDEAARAAEASEPAKAVPVYRRAFAAARDLDQIKLLAGRLRDLGQEVDLARQMGFVVGWKAIGPFDNVDEKGYDVAYPPERNVDPEAVHPGKEGKVRWIDHATTHDHGLVDFNKVFGEKKGVIAYAQSRFLSDKRREVEIRTTSFNAVKLWLNGTPVDEHPIYHAGSQLDQYVCRVTLEPGANVILIKVCQNEQTQSWARVWNFKLRVCDTLGGAILSTDRAESLRKASADRRTPARTR